MLQPLFFVLIAMAQKFLSLLPALRREDFISDKIDDRKLFSLYSLGLKTAYTFILFTEKCPSLR